MYENISFFDKPNFVNDKPIRLVELFAGIGAQAKALARLGIKYEKHAISEWEINAVASYRAIHHPEDHNDYSNGIDRADIVEQLVMWGISTDGKEPMTRKQIASKNEKWQRTVYSNFISTHNLGSVTNVTGTDLGIVDTDKFTYLLTYSFPCQDLSVAGLGGGMEEDSGTRSALLWEVKRLIDECPELPQLLLMENVPQVHGKKNIANFHKWIQFLESKGYNNYYKDLNSKNFGIPQNRNRTFMISILGEYQYTFPEEKPLTLCLGDLLEENVDDKFYLTADYIEYAQNITAESEAKGNNFKFNPVEKSGGGVLR